MNLFKLALKNIRKSAKDYSVYFLTLVVVIAVFYMFNSVGSQSFMETITTSKNYMLQLLVSVIEIISVGVAIVLGILITYANNFLIKRRKKEFGVYMMLGMSERRVSAILSVETLMVGAISLIAGMILGIFGSQLLSLIVGKLFEADLSGFTFTFSASVMGKTILYFAIIFVAVLIFNAKTLTKYRLIDLLNAQKKAEKKIFKNPAPAVVLFIIAVALILFTYYELIFRGEVMYRNEFLLTALAGFVGTFLFFIALSGFLPYFLGKRKKFYNKELNSFVCTQFGHNLNSSAVSFSVISLLLFIAICAFSVGFSMNGYLNNRLKGATPADVAVENIGSSISDILNEKGHPVSELLKESEEITVYYGDSFTMGSTVAGARAEAEDTFTMARWETKAEVFALSEYNRLEKLYGRKEIELKEDEYVILCDFDLMVDLVNLSLKRGNPIEVGSTTLNSKGKKALDEFILMSGTSANIGKFIVSDELIANNPECFEKAGSILVGNYQDESSEDVFSEIFEGGEYDSMFTSKVQVASQNISTAVSVVFIVLYIGIVFIITSAAVIALKILSDSIDSVEKYSILMKIGAERAQRTRALFWQTFLNFFMPFLVGLLHSIPSLYFAKGLLRTIGMTKMFSGTIIAVMVMLLVYGGYFLVTYGVCRRIVITENINDK